MTGTASIHMTEKEIIHTSQLFEKFKDYMPDFMLVYTDRGIDITKVAYELSISYIYFEAPAFPRKKCLRYMITWEDAMMLVEFNQIGEFVYRLRKALDEYTVV